MLLGNFDKNLQEHLLTGRRNATSTSKTVQEEVIHITGEYIWVKDVSPKIKEVFFDYVYLEKTTGVRIANTILSSLAENNTNVAFARGQAYDGANAMFSEACGVQGRIRRIALMALYAHCNSHILNLSVAATCRLTSVRNMIETLNETFLFFHFLLKDSDL